MGVLRRVNSLVRGSKGRPQTAAARRGAVGEQLAEMHLRGELGFKVVTRNWRNGKDEIDLVCRDGDVLVFVEVRARSADALVSGYHSVDKHKREVLRRAFKAYMRKLRSPPVHFRFDIAEVALSKDGANGTVRHFANVPLFGKHFSPAKY